MNVSLLSNWNFIKKQILGESPGIQLVYMNDKEEVPSKSSILNKLGTTNGSEKKTTFAALPNTTTWQQQSSQNNQHQMDSKGDEAMSPNRVMPSQLSDIKMKMDEKRRLIESEKRRMEMAMNKQRQQVGRAAFFQTVAKVSKIFIAIFSFCVYRFINVYHAF